MLKLYEDTWIRCTKSYVGNRYYQAGDMVKYVVKKSAIRPPDTHWRVATEKEIARKEDELMLKIGL